MAYSNPLDMAYRSSDTTSDSEISPEMAMDWVLLGQRSMAKLTSKYLKELRGNTFSSSDHEDANEHIEKVLKIVDPFHIPEITQDQIMLRAFPMSLTGAATCWLRNEPSGSIITWEALKKKFLSKYCPPARTAKK
ncbi:hypothetical protein Tco_0944242 [Tanacetum coccineum]